MNLVRLREILFSLTGKNHQYQDECRSVRTAAMPARRNAIASDRRRFKIDSPSSFE
jgi:hypothetical protein